MGRATVLIALTTSILLHLAAPALAWSQGSEGRKYEGTQEAGGPVRLVVVEEPARIIMFEVEGIAGGGCSWDTITLENWGGEILMVEGQFEATNADGDVLQGAWLGDSPADRRFEGTIQVNDPVKGCQTPPLRWVAAASPAP